MQTIESVDIFKTRYRMNVQPYAGIDYSKKCFVFSGQGSMAPGEGRGLLERFEVVRKRFQKADELAEAAGVVKPSTFVRAPETLTAQDLSLARSLSLFTMSVSLFELLLSLGERPALLTAHSYGEYAALVAAGVLRFEEAFEILIDREKALSVSSGGMIAVSASAEQIRGANLGSDVFIANSNSPYQTVLAVSHEKAKATLQQLKKSRLPAKWLEQVSQPFHSPLLKEAKIRFATLLKARSLTPHAPQIPIFSSVTGKILNQAPSAKQLRDLLVDQLTTPVDFVAQLQGCLQNNVRHFVDLSMASSTSPWIVDSLGSEKFKVTKPPVFKVEAAPIAKKQFRATHDSKMVGLLNKVISSVTGYSIAEISLSKNFQEDLGIDSIKKAQIVLNFLDSQGKINGDLRDGVTMNRLRTVEDVLTWFSSEKKSGPARAAAFNLYQKVWKEEKLQTVSLTSPLSVSWVTVEDLQNQGLKPAWLNADALIVDATDNRLDFAKFLNRFREQMDLF